MSEEIENSIASERLTVVLVSAVGLCAALFAGAGIYGTLAHTATLRLAEGASS